MTAPAPQHVCRFPLWVNGRARCTCRTGWMRPLPTVEVTR